MKHGKEYLLFIGVLFRHVHQNLINDNANFHLTLTCQSNSLSLSVEEDDDELSAFNSVSFWYFRCIYAVCSLHNAQTHSERETHQHTKSHGKWIRTLQRMYINSMRYSLISFNSVLVSIWKFPIQRVSFLSVFNGIEFQKLVCFFLPKCYNECVEVAIFNTLCSV